LLTVWVLDSGGSVFAIDEATTDVATRLQTERGRAASMAIGEGAVWVANYEDRSVTRIDPVALRVEDVIGALGKPIYLAAGVGSVWVTLQTRDEGLMRIDASTNTVSQLDLSGIAKACGHGAVWIDQPRRFDVSALLRFDPSTAITIEIGEFVNMGSVVPDDRAIWIDHESDRGSVLSRVDASTNRVVQTIAVPQPSSLTVIDGALVLAAPLFPKEELTEAGAHRGAMFRIEPARSGAVRTLPITGSYELATGYGSIWACQAGGREVLRIDPERLAVTHRIEVGNELVGISTDEQWSYSD
jgi:streptogramin lyase